MQLALISGRGTGSWGEVTVRVAASAEAVFSESFIIRPHPSHEKLQSKYDRLLPCLPMQINLISAEIRRRRGRYGSQSA